MREVSVVDTRHSCLFGSIEYNIQINMGRCRPHVWGLIWGYMETLVSVTGDKKTLPNQRWNAGWAGLNKILNGYIKPNSTARLTAARRVLTLSLL